MSTWNSVSSKIQVFCRVRPKLKREKNLSDDSSFVNTYETDDTLLEIRTNNSCGVKTNSNTSRYVLDHVFPPNSKQKDVYEKLNPILRDCFKGINCTVYCYGQTGTGKTHTMLGIDMWGIAAAERVTSRYYDHSDDSKKSRKRKNKNKRTFDNRAKWGIIPNTATMVFHTLERMKEKKEIHAYTVSCTYLELYNERIYDLLSENDNGKHDKNHDNISSNNTDDDNSPRNRKKALDIREDKVKGVFVPGASDIVVDNEEHILCLLWEGAKNRAVSATDMNEYSSRSHTIFQIIIEIETKSFSNDSENGPRIIRRSKINLVDLAGSETMKENKIASLNQKRINELTSINQSLSCLGNCVRALSQLNRTHVPYRDSKLTRLLQDSLGGNTKTTFIVTISPDSSALSESISTLQFADRAKQVKVNIFANETLVAADALKHAEHEIKRLKGLLKVQSKIEKSRGSKKDDERVTIEYLKNTIRKLQNQLENIHRDEIIHRHRQENIEPIIKKVRESLIKKSEDGTFNRYDEKKWMSTYNRWLKSLPTVGIKRQGREAPITDRIDHSKLSVKERLRLMEWSVLLQMEELEKAKDNFILETEKMAKQIAIMKLKTFGKSHRHLNNDNTTHDNIDIDDDSSQDMNMFKQEWKERGYSVNDSQDKYEEVYNQSVQVHDLQQYEGEEEEDEYDNKLQYYSNNAYQYSEQEVRQNELIKKKDQFNVSQELEDFMKTVVITPNSSPMGGIALRVTDRESRDANSSPQKSLAVRIEHSTNEFITDEVQSPSRIWHRVFDTNTGQNYYFNEKTKATQWHEPTSPSVEIRYMPTVIDDEIKY